MSNRALATAQTSTTSVPKPIADGVLQRQGVTALSWQPESQTVTGHNGALLDIGGGFSAAPPPAEIWADGQHRRADSMPPAVRARTTTIRDDDAGRALLTWWLIHELAPLLGLDPNRIEIRVNSEAESRVNARGANGVMEGGTIYLHPVRYRPHTREGRHLLAHEATHVAQLHTPGTADTMAAEREAAEIASAIAARRTFPRPVRRLSPLAVAADVDAPTEEKPVPLADSVAQSRAREIAAIKKLLSGLWISDGDVFGVLQIMETVDFFVARAIIRALTPKERYELADNINPPHFNKYRKQVLACYAALTPDQFRKLDEDLVEEMDLNPRSMSVEEREAAAYTVHHLDNDSLQDLLKSTNRTFVKLLLAWPALEDQDRRELEKRESEAAQGEAAESKRLKDIGEKFANDPALVRMLDRVRKLMAGPESFEPKDVQNLSRRCVLVLDTLSGLRNQANTMEYIGRQLDSEGLTDKLVEFLPEASRFDTPEHTETFLALLQARLPEKNIQLAEELLSYSALDWAVRDNEAEFAYRLIRRLPLAAQDRFRKRDNGKWFMRLEDNIDKKLGEKIQYTGIEVGRDARGKLYDAAALYAQKLESGEGTQALGNILNEIEKDGINAKTAETIFARIAAIGGAKFDVPPPPPGGQETTDTIPSAQEGKPSRYFKPADQVLMDAVVRRLDRLGYIETLLTALDDRFLFNEDNFASTLKIMLARDPVRVQAHARDLVDRGFLGLGMVTDREAFLAFQMVKALPDAERQAFMEEGDGAAWTTILAEMSADMRKAQGVNLYVGDKAGTDRASILGQLLDDTTWSAANVLKLDGLVHMAIAMGEHKFAFEQSAIGERHAIPELKKVYVKYKLYDPATRRKYSPNLLEGTKWYQEGIFESIRTLVSGVVFLVKNDLLLFTKTQGANDLNLNDLQDVLGGDIKGVKLADPTAAQPERKEAPEANPDANKVTIHLDVGARVFHAWLPELRIDSVNFHTGGLTFQCGMLTLKNLQISAAFGSEDEKQPSHARLTAGELTISDLLLAFRESMMAVSRFFIAAPKVAAGTTDAEKASNVPPRAGYHVPVPFLARISALVWYIFKYKGWWGAQSPMNAAMEGFEPLRAAEISFSSLHVDGLTTSGGQSLAGIDVKDFHLRIGLTKPAFLRAHIGSLDQRIRAMEAARAAADTIKPLREQRDKADAELKKLEAGEAELVALETKYIHDRGNFTDDDRRRIEALQKGLKGGAFLDIGSIDVTGISGTVTAEPIHLKGLHGEGESAAMGIGFVTDADFIKKFAGDEARRFNRDGEEIRQPRLSEQAGDAKFALEIAEFHTGKITVSGLPSAKDLDERLAKLEKVKHQPTYAEDYRKLLALRDKAALYEQYTAVGISALGAKQRKEAAQLREDLRREPKLVIGSIDLKKAAIGYDALTNRVSLGAEEATVTGLDYREKGIKVREIYGKNLQAGATATGGIMGWLEWRKHLRSADVHAELLRFQGVEHAQSGIAAEEIAIENLGADVSTNGGDATAGLRAPKITVSGANLKFSEYALRLAKQRLLERDRESLPPEKRKQYDTKLAQITDVLDTLDEYKRLLAADEAALQHAKTDEERTAAKKMLDMDRGTLAAWNRQLAVEKLTVADLNLTISRLGDILSLGYSFEKVLDKGIQIKGGGPQGQLFKNITATTVMQNQGDRTGTNIQEVSVGPFSGTVDYSTSETRVHGTLESAQLSGLSYHSPAADIWCSGTAQLTKLTLAITVHTPPKDDEGRPADGAATKVEVDTFHIEVIRGTGLGYKNKESGLQVDITSGGLRDIWLRGLQLEMPADEFADLVIREDPSRGKPGAPTGFGVGQVEDVALAATTKEGMRVSGMLNAGLKDPRAAKTAEGVAGTTPLNAQALDAHFADNGDQEINLNFLRFSGGKLTQGDLDVGINSTIRGIRVSLLASGKKVINARDVSVAARGKKGKTEFAVDIENAQTGDIIEEGNKITVPNAVLPSIKLPRLHFENAQYVVDVPEGQTVELIGTTLNLEIEKNPEPKSGESSLRKISIRELKVPYTAVRGCTITLVEEDGDDLTITLPNGISGGIENIWIKPSEDVAKRFTIIPDQNWAIVGGFSFDRANLVRVGAKLPSLFDASANVGLEGFYMGFLTDGSTTLNLSRVVAKEIRGQIKGSKFSMTTGKSRHGGDAGVVVQGIHKNKDGLSIDQLGAFGFVYENTGLGLTLDIQGAVLPGPTGGFSMPKDGPIKIPKLAIGKAFFHINDLMAMDTGGAKGAPSKIDEGLLNFLDTLHGDIDLVLHVDADYVRKLTRDFPVVIRIEKGQINYLKLEKSIFKNSDVLQQAIDFEYDKSTGRLFVQLDLKTIALAIGLVSPIGGGVVLGGGAAKAGTDITGTRELYGWDLRENDRGINERKLAEQKQVRLKSLIRPFLPDGTPSTDSGKEEPLPIDIADIDARVRQITLGLKGQSVIDLAHLNKSGLRGRIKLGAPGLDAVTGLTVTGDMKKGFALGLGGINLAVDGLAIDGDWEPSKKRPGVTTKSDITVSTGQIHIGSLEGTSLTFEKGRRGALKHLQIYPAQLEGTVSSATAENIEVTLKKEKRGEKKEATR